MTLKDFVDALRNEFQTELAAKTGWGRVELMQAFERAVANALAKNIQIETR